MDNERFCETRFSDTPSASRYQRPESSDFEAKEIFRFQRRQQLTGIELKLSFRYGIESRFAIAKAFGTQTTDHLQCQLSLMKSRSQIDGGLTDGQNHAKISRFKI